MALRPLKDDPKGSVGPETDGNYIRANDWRSADGSYVQLCVVEELNREGEFNAEAVITFGGFSLCREHFEAVTDLIRGGMPMGTIVNQMMTDGLDG